ncbi:MAG: hypothetical protein H6685_02705 [Deltaproteobacteria bacterium]|nr:hypothetical protein [Deltaproteobacteria bacterium]
MNVPPATLTHRLRARRRVKGGDASKVVVWQVAHPGEDTSFYDFEAPDNVLLRERGMEIAEQLADEQVGLVVFVGPMPTAWPDIFDAAERLRQGGAACVLATPPDVFNAMGAPVIAYHFTIVYALLPQEPTAEDLARVKILADLSPRCAIEARVYGHRYRLTAGQIDPKAQEQLRRLGVKRVEAWPPPTSIPCRVVSPTGEITTGESVWAADHIWTHRA